MKPNFALNFSHDGIGLLHRGKKGWHLVGEVSLDDADFTENLRFLRLTAVELDPGGLSTKLVIPASQILYTEVAAPGPSDGERRMQIRAALDGATPYEVDDLAFDWSGNGDKIKVAAVARDTLDEAESFACEHNFNPLSFVAMPENGAFAGEPFFGIAGAADTVLDGAETVERDGRAIRILGPVAADSEGGAAEGVADQEAQAAADDPGSETQDPTQAGNEPGGATAAPEGGPEPEDAPQDAPDAQPPAAAKPLPSFATQRRPGTIPPKEAPLWLENIPSRIAIVSGHASQADPDSAGEHDGTEAVTSKPAAKPGRKQPVLTAVETLVAANAPVSATAGSPGQEVAQATAGAAVSARSAPPALAGATKAPGLSVFGARKKPGDGHKPRYLGLILTVILLAFLAATALWSALFLGNGLAFWRGADQDAAVAQQPGLPTEPQALPEITTEPVAAAAPAPAPALPTDPPASEQLVTLGDPALLPDDPVLAPGYEPEPEAEPGFSDVDTPAPAPDARALVQDPDPRPVLSPEEAARAYASSGIWQKAPAAPREPRPDETETLYIASIDPEIAADDAVALPPVPATPDDLELPAQASPAVAGTQFTLDERGLVVLTPEGVENPDGIMVFAGPPAVKPRARGGRVPQVVQPEPDTRLATLRPRARPSDLRETTEKALLGGRTRSELAALRPRARPAAPKIEEEVDQTPTAQAVAVSRLPNHRPGNFAKLVARARERAAEAPTQLAAAVPTPQAVMPKIPTTASVARQATVTNAINLRRVNLIGVYGTSSKRRALVRLPSGRYVKVEVGDRMDGGKVAAIGESSLKYIKGGRNITLQMPQG